MAVNDNVQDKRLNEDGFKLLHTYLDEETHFRLTKLARSKKTAMGAWDYGNTIRELLDVNELLLNVNMRMDYLEQEVRKSAAKEIARNEVKKSVKISERVSLGLMGNE